MDCHASPTLPVSGTNLVALVGQPNVGKSALFQRLTGQRVTVSNYPGTTVEVARAALRDLPGCILVDTPGVIAFPPVSDEERVTQRLLLGERLQAVVQVGDAKNLRRTLLFTVQLAEMGLPLLLALNMMDEAERRGVSIRHAELSERLGLPVIPAAAVHGRGVEQIRRAVSALQPAQLSIPYGERIESTLQEMEPFLAGAPLSPRSLGLLFLSGDALCETWLAVHLAAQDFAALQEVRRRAQNAPARRSLPPTSTPGNTPVKHQTLPDGAAHTDFTLTLAEEIQQARLDFVRRLTAQVSGGLNTAHSGFSARLGALTTHPVWGVPILLAVLAAVYWFVGVFGAGTLVGLLEENLFGGLINPWFTALVQRISPLPLLSDFIVGEYGLWTMGMTYAFALILPIVSAFFLAFGVLEDSGYLPRLAALSNKLFSLIGLNGKAVLPMVLGLGCVTMGTLTTRVLESKRERVLTTLLLALAVPCSAQLGVVMGMLAGISTSAVILWSGVVLLVLMTVGWLAAKLVPGERSQLLVELPPMRLPQFSNVILKTLARLEWYISEVAPLFLLGAAVLFVLDKTSLLAVIADLGRPLVTGWLGLPPEVSVYFLMGFLRRDFGATGLFIMQQNGLLSPGQVIVAMVTITLFIPCIASVMMIIKERGWRQTLGIVPLVFGLAFLVGGLLQRALQLIGGF